MTLKSGERVYTPSDLATTRRKEFLLEAHRGQAVLRDTDGVRLSTLRSTTLESLAALRDHTLAYLTLEAVIRNGAEARAIDFGAWAFLAEFDLEDLMDFRAEIADALSIAASTSDHTAVEIVLDEWRRSARVLADPTSRAILTDEVDADDFVDAGRPD